MGLFPEAQAQFQDSWQLVEKYRAETVTPVYRSRARTQGAPKLH
jgi:hypothetical protein